MANLIERFVRIEATRCETTETYLKWSGVALLSAICGRSVHSRLIGKNGPPLFPNTFIILVGAPSQGKTQAIAPVKKMFGELGVTFGADTVTPQSLIRWASGTSSKKIEDGKDPSIVLALENMDSILTGKNDPKLKSFLCAAYDCSERYTADTIKRGNETARKLCLTFLAGGTPAHVASAFEAREWAEGLAARFLFISSDEDPLENTETDTVEAAALIDALEAVQSRLEGRPVEIPWSDDARASRKALARAIRRQPPVHPNAVGYWAKKPLSVAKLAMLFSVSDDSWSVDSSHWDQAMAWLATMENSLPSALAMTGGNQYAGLQASIVKWAASIPRPIPEHEIRARMVNMVSPMHLDAIMEAMISSHQLLVMEGEGRPNRKLLHPKHHQTYQASRGVTQINKVVSS